MEERTERVIHQFPNQSFSLMSTAEFILKSEHSYSPVDSHPNSFISNILLSLTLISIIILCLHSVHSVFHSISILSILSLSLTMAKKRKILKNVSIIFILADSTVFKVSESSLGAERQADCHTFKAVTPLERSEMIKFRVLSQSDGTCCFSLKLRGTLTAKACTECLTHSSTPTLLTNGFKKKPAILLNVNAHTYWHSPIALLY